MSNITEKLALWIDTDKGLKSRINTKKPVVARSDIPQVKTQRSLDRGERLQRARLRRYPSLDVNHRELFAGWLPNTLDQALETLYEVGFRDNPTAYVEVSDELGPDDWSLSLQSVTETGGDRIVPQITSRVRHYRRMKRQIHLALYSVKESDSEYSMFDSTADEITVVYAHEERSAWLQPMRHVTVNNSSARVGVRDFREKWYDETGSELPGKDSVKWRVSR